MQPRSTTRSLQCLCTRAESFANMLCALQRKSQLSSSTMGKPPSPPQKSSKLPPPPIRAIVAAQGLQNTTRMRMAMDAMDTDSLAAPVCARPVSPVMTHLAQSSVSLHLHQGHVSQAGTVNLGGLASIASCSPLTWGYSIYCRSASPPWVNTTSHDVQDKAF